MKIQRCSQPRGLLRIGDVRAAGLLPDRAQNLGNSFSTAGLGRAMTWAAISLPRPSTFSLPAATARSHGGEFALDDDGDVAAAEFLLADHLDVGGFAGGVDGLEDGGEALGLDEAQGRGVPGS